MIMAIIGWIIFGLVVGLIARALMPGPQPMGFILTALLGVAGSFIGGWLGTLLFGGGEPDASQAAGWIGSIIGALILLFGYGMVTKRPTSP
jgi:uncharacterized membrane protein YeaQ/YmgE (transglycosylase-associated protein family)